MSYLLTLKHNLRRKELLSNQEYNFLGPSLTNEPM